MAINLEGGIGLKPTIVSDVPNLSSLSFRSQYELCLKFFFFGILLVHKIGHKI